MSRILMAVATLTVLTTLARAQTAESPSAEGTALVGDLPVGAFLVTVVIALFITGVVVKVSDREHDLREAALALQTRLAEALLADPTLARLPVVATARARVWRRSPVTIAISGRVPTPALREGAIALVMREALGTGTRFRIEDRMDTDPSVFGRAA